MKIPFFVLSILLALSVPALGADHRSGETVVVKSDETISEDFFVASRSVHMAGSIVGDIYAVGERLVVDGDVSEDVLATCRSLELTGNVGDSVLFTGQILTIAGTIGGDVMALGADINIAPGAVINGDLFVAAGRLTMEGGLINGSIKGHVGETVLNGSVQQDIDLEGGSITFGNAYQGRGAVRLTLEAPLDPDQAGLIPDNLEVKIKEPERSFPFFGLFGIIWSLVAAFLIGLALVIFFRPTVRDYLDFARTDPMPKVGMGFVYLVVIPVVILILLLMIFTIPGALIALVLYLIALYVGKILAGLVIGEWIVKRFRKDHPTPSLVLSLIVGIVVVSFLTRIPFLGMLIALVVVCYGLGSLINFLWQYRRAPEASAEF